MKNLKLFRTAALILFLVCIIAGLPACSDGDGKDSEGNPNEDNSSGNEGSHSVLLIADMSLGSASEEHIQVNTYESDQEISPEEIIEALSDWTGLDFFVTISYGDKVTVDWLADSTLIAGLDDREQKEDFFFFDADSMRWFMMDSLRLTLATNIAAEEIYYTMDGGKELAFEELYPVKSFASDIPYMGSAFYYAHDDVVGD